MEKIYNSIRSLSISYLTAEFSKVQIIWISGSSMLIVDAFSIKIKVVFKLGLLNRKKFRHEPTFFIIKKTFQNFLLEVKSCYFKAYSE